MPNRVAAQVKGVSAGPPAQLCCCSMHKLSGVPSGLGCYTGFRARRLVRLSPSPQVLERLMGNPPKYVRSGATIPALAAFQKHLNISTTVFAFGLPDGNLRE